MMATFDCDTCADTGTSYWSDDVYGNCLDCCCIDCGEFLAKTGCKCVENKETLTSHIEEYSKVFIGLYMENKGLSTDLESVRKEVRKNTTKEKGMREVLREMSDKGIEQLLKDISGAEKEKLLKELVNQRMMFFK